MLVNRLPADFEIRGDFAERIIVVIITFEERLLLLREQRSVKIEQYVDPVRLVERVISVHQGCPFRHRVALRPGRRSMDYRQGKTLNSKTNFLIISKIKKDVKDFPLTSWMDIV